MQAGIDPQVLAAASQREVVQLALAGSSPLPVLEHLAADPSFRGVALVEFLPRVIFDAGAERESEALALVAAYQSWFTPGNRSEAVLGGALRSVLVLRRQQLTAVAVLRGLLRGSSPPVPYVTTRPDRMRRLDFSKTDAARRERLLARRIVQEAQLPDEAAMQRVLARIESAAGALEVRGGEILLVRFPVSGQVASAEEQLYPRADYWDVLARSTRARAVHLSDEVALEQFSCPDGSHLDQRDVSEFTLQLAAALGLASD